MYVCKINDDMYQRDITLCFNGTGKQFQAYVRRKYNAWVDDPDDGGDGHYYKFICSDGSKYYVIWLKKFGWFVEDYGILAHEIMHLVHRILDEIGFRLSDDSEEAYCYYFQIIYQECIAGIKEKLKKKK